MIRACKPKDFWSPPDAEICLSYYLTFSLPQSWCTEPFKCPICGAMVLRLEVLTTTLVTFKPWYCPWCELTCPEFSPEAVLPRGAQQKIKMSCLPLCKSNHLAFWQKVIHIHLTFYWGAGTISCSSKEHVWTNSTADLPQAFSKERWCQWSQLGVGCGPSSGVGESLPTGLRRAGVLPQSAPSVTAEQGDFFQAAQGSRL